MSDLGIPGGKKSVKPHLELVYGSLLVSLPHMCMGTPLLHGLGNGARNAAGGLRNCQYRLDNRAAVAHIPKEPAQQVGF